MNEEIKELCVKASGRAIGPLKLSFALIESDLSVGRLALENAIEDGIIGGELWLLFKDVHGGDLIATREALCLGDAIGQLSELRYSTFYKGDAE